MFQRNIRIKISGLVNRIWRYGVALALINDRALTNPVIDDVIRDQIVVGAIACTPRCRVPMVRHYHNGQ